MMLAKRKTPVPSLNLGIEEMRKKLALLKQGKLIVPNKKPKKPRPG
jgi:hypothetical protein